MDTRMNLSDEENELYTKLFVQCDLDGYGYVSGNTTCELFRKSGLSDDVLFSIWEVADTNNSGQLDFSSFCVCLRLIAHVQLYGPDALHDSDVLMNKTPEELPLFSGHPGPDYNVNPLNSYGGESDLYSISGSDFEDYKYTFIQLTNDPNEFLYGDDARAFYLKTTTLSQDDLMHLWSLADFDKDGRLSLREFCVMQKLCECLKLYGTLPRLLPEPLFDFLESDTYPDYPPLDSVDPNTYLPTTDVDSKLPPPGLEGNLQTNKGHVNMGDKGIRNDSFNTDLPQGQVSNAHVTNELILQCENLLNTLRDAINSEKNSLLNANKESNEIETKLKSDTKTLENLLTEYRSLVGDSQNMSRRRSLLNNKLSIIQDQIQELRNQIQSIRVSSVALSSNIDKNNEEQSLLQNTRQMFLKQLEEETSILKVEERELGELSNHFQQLKRQRDLLLEKNNQLRECLSQSENATKTMLRSIQLQQGKIMSVRNERINLLEEKLKMTNEINRLNNSENNLNSSAQTKQPFGFIENSSNIDNFKNKNNVNRNVNLDKKGIRVSSVSLKVGDEFPQ